MARPRTAWAKARLVLDAKARGATNREAALVGGVSPNTVIAIVGEYGVMPIRERCIREGSLTPEDREEIMIGIRNRLRDAEIARIVGVHRGTIGREIEHNGGRERYRASHAQDRADRRARRTRRRWWESRPELWQLVCDKLIDEWWSPEQISVWLRRTHPDQPEWWVSHESIYQAIYLQAKGELKRQLTEALRTGRAVRHPRGKRRPGAGAKIVGMVNISERPAEAEDRAVPGHWEGDLIVGANNQSMIATLVERSTRFGMLVKVDSKDAAHVADRLSKAMVGLPDHSGRRRSPGTRAPNSPTTPSSVLPPVSQCSSAIRTHPGNGAATRTGTGSSASSSRKEPIYQSTLNNTSTTSLPNSTGDHARPSDGKPQPNDTNNLSQPQLEPAVVNRPKNEETPAEAGVSVVRDGVDPSTSAFSERRSTD